MLGGDGCGYEYLCIKEEVWTGSEDLVLWSMLGVLGCSWGVEVESGGVKVTGVIGGV